MSDEPSVHFYIKGRKGTKDEGKYLKESSAYLTKPPYFVDSREEATWYSKRSSAWYLIDNYYPNNAINFQVVAVTARKKLFLRNNSVLLTTHQIEQVQYGAEEYKKTGNLEPLLLLMKYAVRVTPIETAAHSGTLLRLIDAATAVKITQGKNAIALDGLYKAALAYEP